MRRKSSSADGPEPGEHEAEWYTTPEGRRRTRREFERALKDGTLIRSSGLRVPRSDPKFLKQLMRQAKENVSRPISIRIPIADLEKARQIAKKTGLGYQTVLKRAIRTGLRRAG